jgi:hypothetical protein
MRPRCPILWMRATLRASCARCGRSRRPAPARAYRQAPCTHVCMSNGGKVTGGEADSADDALACPRETCAPAMAFVQAQARRLLQAIS